MQYWERAIMTAILGAPSSIGIDDDVETCVTDEEILDLVKHALLIREESLDLRNQYLKDFFAKNRQRERAEELEWAKDCLECYTQNMGTLQQRWIGLKVHMERTVEGNKESQQLSSMPYKEFLQTKYWKTVREHVLERDKSCRLCHATDNLHVHHNSYEYRGEEYAHLDTLITLCSSCHSRFHHVNGKDAVAVEE